jgi:hypothetical protein
MGHATIAITYDLYGHLMPGSYDEAADYSTFLARQLGGENVEPTAPRTAPHPPQGR